MSQPAYPATLTPANWDKQKGLIAKAKPTGIGEALKALEKARGNVDFTLFADAAPKTVAEAEARLAAQDAEARKGVKAAADQARAVAVLARKAEADFKANALIPKSATQAAGAVAKAAGDYAGELDKMVQDAQAELRKKLDALKASAAKQAKDKGEEDEDPSLDKLKTTVISAMRLAKKAMAQPGSPPVNFMIGEKDKTCMAFVTPKSVGETQKKVLKKLIGSESGVKFYKGEVAFDGKLKSWVFEGENIPTGGFAKKLQGGLKSLTGTAYRLRVRKSNGETDDVDGDDADHEEHLAEGGKAPGGNGSGGGDGAQAKALLERLVKLKPALDKLVAKGGPTGPAVTKAQEQAKASILAMQLDQAAKLVERLAEMAAEGAGGGAKPGPGAAPAKPDAGAARDEQRKTADAVLSQITALVLGAINDDALRKLINDELGKLKAGFDHADKLGDAHTAEAGFRAVKVKADALLERANTARAISDWVQATLQPAQTRAKDAVAALTLPAAQKVLQARLAQLEADRARDIAALALPPLQSGVLPGLQQVSAAAAALDGGVKKIDTDLAAVAQVVAAMGTDAPAPLAEQLRALQARRAGAWPAGATAEALQKAVTDFAAELKLVVDAAVKAKKTVDDKKKYEADFLAIKADYDKARAALASAADTFTDLAKKSFNDAEKGRSDAVAASDWLAAIGSVGNLKVAAAALVKAINDRKAYDTARAAVNASINAALNHCYSNTSGMAEPENGNLWSAKKAVDAEVQQRNWVAAKSKLADLVLAARAVQQVVVAGQAYYDAFDAIAAEVSKAWFSADKVTSEKMAALAVDYKTALKRTQELAVKKQWVVAITTLPTLQMASIAMNQARVAFDSARAPFDAQFNAITTDLAQARAITAAPPKKLKGAQVKTFREAFAVVNDARNAGEFDKALAALPALKNAIADLLRVKAQFDSERSAYEAEMAKVAKREQAAALAASPPPTLSTEAAEFVKADEALNALVRAENWTGAKDAVAALKAATDKLLAAKAKFNTAAKPADIAAFRKKLEALKPRTDKANAAPVPLFVDYLQRAVRDRLASIELLLGEKDLAAAEASLVTLGTETTAMEQGKTAWAAHKVKFDAAKNGEVKKARDLALAPAKLAQERTQALDKAEQAITLLVDKNQLSRADARVVQWIAEAKAWAGSKEAYDSLATGTPDEAKLKALGDQPGGGEVLDALVLGLPDNTPQMVLSTALKARFGFAVKRFEKPNEDKTDLTGLTAVAPHLPDKSLQRTYDVLTRVPADHLKGKVTELIDYSSNSGGAMFSNNTRKIYMYCGRAEDNAEMTVGKEEEIVPEGENVDPDCKPVDKQPIKTFDHSLLHEAGHGQDLATGTMVGQNKKRNKDFGSWDLHGAPNEVADAAAAHFGADKNYILATLLAADGKPPATLPPKPPAIAQPAWAEAHKKAADWCKLVRVGNELWNQPTLSKQIAINGRVYQEAYAGRWVSYDVSTRSKGISAYQFRSEWEWFAELYAAYFSGKLASTHPATKWLSTMKKPD